jgi:uncharacterized protein YciI
VQAGCFLAKNPRDGALAASHRGASGKIWTTLAEEVLSGHSACLPFPRGLLQAEAVKYFFCKLHPPRKDFVRDMTPAEGQLMQQHAAYLQGFSAKGWAVVYGPVADPQGGFGVGIWELPDQADINGICADDPTIKSGLGFRYEIHPMPRAVVRK